MDRRSFFRFFAAAPVALPVIIAEAETVEVSPFAIDLMERNPGLALAQAQEAINHYQSALVANLKASQGRPIFASGDLMYEGVIIRGDSYAPSFDDYF